MQLLPVILLALIIIACLAYLIESAFFRGGMRAVYMGSDLGKQGEAIKAAVDEFIGKDTADYPLVEPGAGIGHVARFLIESYRWKTATAIELRPTVFWAGKLLAWKRFPQLRYLRQDLFAYPYEPGSLIYCYLTTPIISRLYREGALKGSLVICLTFSIEGAKPTKEYPLAGWQGALRVYDFR